MCTSKEIVTARGLKYRYLVSPPKDGKLTLLFVHGFPSTSRDWRHQIAFFEKEGYGVIAPDMLGYGETAKPTDPAVYKCSLITADIIDILNEEKVDKAIAIGHDWGSLIVSRLANIYPERFVAFAFLALAYVPPNTQFDLDSLLAQLVKVLGYEPYGYWKFFAAPGAHKMIEENLDSFFSCLFPADPKMWVTNLAPTGALEASLKSGFTCPLPSFVTEDDKQAFKETFQKNGFEAPLCWYRVTMEGHGPEDDKAIPLDRYIITKPVFFGAAKQDYVCFAQGGITVSTQTCKALTIKEFDTGHWLPLEAPDRVNSELFAWIEDVERKL